MNGAGSDICDSIFDMLNYMDSTGVDTNKGEKHDEDVDFYTLCTDEIAKELYLDEEYYSIKDDNGKEVKLGELTAKDLLTTEEALMLSKIMASIKSRDIVCVQITKWIWDHKEVFDNFMKENNNESYQPYDIESFNDIDEEFYDIYIQTWLGLINGQYAEEDYENLYNALIRNKKGGK